MKIRMVVAGLGLALGAALAASPANADVASTVPMVPKKCQHVYDKWMDAGIEWEIGSARKADGIMAQAIALAKDSRTKSLLDKQRIGMQDGSYAKSLWSQIRGRLYNGYC